MNVDVPIVTPFRLKELLACCAPRDVLAMLDVVPSQTLYASNLNGKTKKQGEQPVLLRRRLDDARSELKRALHLCFSAFGRVLDVVCLKTPKLRGQAWVVFADVPAATNALRALQGFNFYDRPLVRAAALPAAAL